MDKFKNNLIDQDVSSYKYDAFISYRRIPEHLKFAKKFELHLKRYGQSLLAIPRKIFRDDQELHSGEYLEKIFDSLKNSRVLILLASPEASESEWINKELDYFCKELGRADDLIIVKLAGNIVIENERIDWQESTALPSSLKGHSIHQRRFEDANLFLNTENANLKNPEYKELINQVVARIEGITPNNLSGKEWRLRRDTFRVIFTSIAIFLISVIALLFTRYELQERTEVLESREKELIKTTNTLQQREKDLQDSLASLEEKTELANKKTREAEVNLNQANENLQNALANAKKAKRLELLRYREASSNEGTACKEYCLELKQKSIHGVNAEIVKLIIQNKEEGQNSILKDRLLLHYMSAIISSRADTIALDLAENSLKDENTYNPDKFVLNFGDNFILSHKSEVELVPGYISEFAGFDTFELAVNPTSRKIFWRDTSASNQWVDENFQLEQGIDAFHSDYLGGEEPEIKIYGMKNSQRSILEFKAQPVIKSSISRIPELETLDNPWDYELYRDWDREYLDGPSTLSFDLDDDENIWPYEPELNAEWDSKALTNNLGSNKRHRSNECDENCENMLDKMKICTPTSQYFDSNTVACWESSTGSSGHTAFGLEVHTNENTSSVSYHFSYENAGDFIRLGDGEILKTSEGPLLGIGWNTSNGAFELRDDIMQYERLESCKNIIRSSKIACIFGNGEIQFYSPQKGRKFTTYTPNISEKLQLNFDEIVKSEYTQNIEYIADNYIIIRQEDIIRKFSRIDGQLLWSNVINFLAPNEKIDPETGALTFEASQYVWDMDSRVCIDWWYSKDLILASCEGITVLLDSHTGITIGSFLLYEPLLDVQFFDDKIIFQKSDEESVQFSIIDIESNDLYFLTKAFSEKIRNLDDFPIQQILHKIDLFHKKYEAEFDQE